MVAKSQPLPFTHSVGIGSPQASLLWPLIEVLPPPCNTSAGSAPTSREP